MRSLWIPEEMQRAAPARPRHAHGSAAAALRAPDQSVLPQGPARQLRQARAHADAGADEHRRRDAARLGRRATGTRTCSRGRRRASPFPQVVGITVHLTFAERAYELARWYRARGAMVVLGGLHVLSCPEEAAPHADALAIGEGVQLWPEILRDVEAGTLRPVYRGELPPAVPRRPAAAPRPRCRATAS